MVATVPPASRPLIQRAGGGGSTFLWDALKTHGFGYIIMFQIFACFSVTQKGPKRANFEFLFLFDKLFPSRKLDRKMNQME